MGHLVAARPDQQIWRFDYSGRPYELLFYATSSGWLGKRLRRNPALNEFHRLQWLQKAGVPAPRAVAVLMGFNLAGHKGDALIRDAIEPSARLGDYLVEYDLVGEAAPAYRELVGQLLDLLESLGKGGLGHPALGPDSFLIRNERLHLANGEGIVKEGLKTADIVQLAHRFRPFAGMTDMLRGWKQFVGGRPPLHLIHREQAMYGGDASRIVGDEASVGRIKIGAWSGQFFRRASLPRRWSAVSRMQFTQADWQEAWPLLLDMMASDQFETLKHSRSGDVLAGDLVIGGKPIPIVIKRPRRKFWYRYINEIGRGMRARRAWNKAWQLVVRDVPTAWPLLIMEKRAWGYPTDALLVLERIPSADLESVDFRLIESDGRRTLFHRIGRMLRRLEETRLFLYDAKCSNWMVWDDPRRGPTPYVIDLDGIRRFRTPRGGIHRLLRSLKDRADFGPDEARALCLGYKPWATATQIEELLFPHGIDPTFTSRHSEAKP